MEVVIQRDYDQMSKAAALLVVDVLNTKPNAVLGMATGSTPLGLYQELVRLYKAGQDLQPRRIRRPARESPAELPLLHARALLPAREHPAAQHQHPLGHDQQLPRVLPMVRGAHRGMRRHRPADPGHRHRRPHRLQRAGELPELAHASQDVVQADHRRQRPVLRRPRGRARLCHHDGRGDHPRCAASGAGGERENQGQGDRPSRGGAGHQHGDGERPPAAPRPSSSTTRRRPA